MRLSFLKSDILFKVPGRNFVRKTYKIEDESEKSSNNKPVEMKIITMWENTVNDKSSEKGDIGTKLNIQI